MFKPKLVKTVVDSLQIPVDFNQFENTCNNGLRVCNGGFVDVDEEREVLHLLFGFDVDTKALLGCIDDTVCVDGEVAYDVDLRLVAGVLKHLVADVVLLGQQPVADLADVLGVHVVHHVLLQGLFDSAFHFARFGHLVVAAVALRLGVVRQWFAVGAPEDELLVEQDVVLIAV